MHASIVGGGGEGRGEEGESGEKREFWPEIHAKLGGGGGVKQKKQKTDKQLNNFAVRKPVKTGSSKAQSPTVN